MATGAQAHDDPRRSRRAPPRLGVRALLALRRGLLALADAVVPAELALFEHAVGIGRTHLLAAAARLRLPDLLAGGPRSAAELARDTGADPDALFRALRVLATMGVLRLGRDGRFAATRLAAAFRSDTFGSLRDLLAYLGSASHVAAWAELGGTLATGRSAFERVHGTSVWEWLARHPEEERIFAGAMVGLTELEVPAIAAGYPWGEVDRLCDVGGGRGTLLAGILRRHARLRGVLFDAAHVLRGAGEYLARCGVARRVELVAGDLLEAVPPGCDAYLLKDVLHDWDDATCRRILGACRQAAAPGARLLVAEILQEPLATAPPGPLVDLQMLVVTRGGRQRSAAEHRALLRAAGFAPGRVRHVAGPFAIVEGIAR